jgi:hypothetical protein
MVWNFRYLWSIIFVFCLLFSAVINEKGLCSENNSENSIFASVAVKGNRIEWHPQVAFKKLLLTVTGPQDFQYERSFQRGSIPFFQLRDNEGNTFPDGLCNYRLVLEPPSGKVKTPSEDLSSGRDATEKLAVMAVAEAPKVQSGSFVIEEGLILSEEATIVMESTAEEEPVGGLNNPDQCINDDAVIDGSLCVGDDCTCPYPSFGFDTIVLAENNLRILFDDTSVGTFPANDWRITINDSGSGGAGYFSIDDVTEGSSPFKVEAGAPSNALYVEDYGRIGLGTSTPYVELHIVDGDSPTIRLDQDASSGWTAQSWDIAGNETNFFVRDVTSGSKLPFRIQPGTPTNTLCLRSTGYVGIGTWAPAANLHIQAAGDSSVPMFLVERTGVASSQTYFTVKDSGDVELLKTMGEGSDRNQKKNIKPIDTAMVLAGVVNMPVSKWNYKVDDDGVRHLGPMAQDFHAAFDLGRDDKHISSIDASGVSFAAIQELNKQLELQKEMILKQNEIIAALEKQIARLGNALKK